jgi:hypothetical protein
MKAPLYIGKHLGARDVRPMGFREPTKGFDDGFARVSGPSLFHKPVQLFSQLIRALDSQSFHDRLHAPLKHTPPSVRRQARPQSVSSTLGFFLIGNALLSTGRMVLQSLSDHLLSQFPFAGTPNPTQSIG